MDAATVGAVAGAVGVAAGALISSVGVVLRERLVGRREREAQQAQRQQLLDDQRATFQRDTILALQQRSAIYGRNQLMRTTRQPCSRLRPASGPGRT